MALLDQVALSMDSAISGAGFIYKSTAFDMHEYIYLTEQLFIWDSGLWTYCVEDTLRTHGSSFHTLAAFLSR